MGPEATAELYLRIIKLFQNKFKAKYDSDFPEIIIINVPIPDVVENSNQQEKVKEMLINAAIKLEKIGSDFIAIPCNTVTYYLTEIQRNINIPIINILQETIKFIKIRKFEKIGLLATETTIKSNIYSDFMNDLLTLSLDKQKQTTKIIMNVLEGKKTNNDKNKLREFIKELKSNGAEKIILGCTELPILIKNNDDCIDTLDILANSVFNISVKK